MRPSVELIYDHHQDIYHASSVSVGLEALAARGRIDLTYRKATAAEADLVADSLTVALFIRDPQHSTEHLAAIDLHDQSHVFGPKILERCDIYFKRSYFEPDLEPLSVDCATKVVPFGLNFASRTMGSSVRMVWRTGLGKLLQGRHGIHGLRKHLVLPKPEEFEQTPDVALEPTIVFQTRVWEPHETAPGECDELNEQRVAVVRALREAFGERFRGGLVPTALAKARYPHEVSIFPTRRPEYIAMSKRNLIGVYTRGLHHSTAFKLPEYLAASQCIVAQTPRNGTPKPMVAGTHFLPFDDPDECVAACQQLLFDHDLAAQMRRANHAYYHAEVAPAAHMERVLERVFLPMQPEILRGPHFMGAEFAAKNRSI